MAICSVDVIWSNGFKTSYAFKSNYTIINSTPVQHGSCPTCRNVFLDVKFPSDSDNESSDGGEYLPEDDEDDEEDLFYGAELDEFEFDVDEMGLDFGSDIDGSFDGSAGAEEDVEEELWTDEYTLSSPELETGSEEGLGEFPHYYSFHRTHCIMQSQPRPTQVPLRRRGRLKKNSI